MGLELYNYQIWLLLFKENTTHVRLIQWFGEYLPKSISFMFSCSCFQVTPMILKSSKKELSPTYKKKSYLQHANQT